MSVFANRPASGALHRFLAPLEIADMAAWAAPNGRLYRRFAAWGFAVSTVRDLRSEEADYDIDGEVSMTVPRAKAAVTLRHRDFTLSLFYTLWDFHGLLSPQQAVRAGGATETHVKACVEPEAAFLRWLARETAYGHAAAGCAAL